jgi:hypothetical protein
LSEQNKRQSEHFTQNEHTGDTCLPINQTGNDLNMKLTLPTEKFNAYSKKVNHDIEDRLKDESAQK